MMRLAVLLAGGCEAAQFLPAETMSNYTQLRTTGFSNDASYTGNLNPGGNVTVEEEERPETVLTFDLSGVDSLCTENRTGDALPTHSCSIFIDKSSSCDEQLGRFWNQNGTLLDPWRDGNYWVTSLGGSSKAAGTNRVGTCASQESLVNKTVVVYDSSTQKPAACGVLSSTTGKLQAQLTKTPGYSGSLEVSGTADVTTDAVRVTVVKGLYPDGLFGTDPVCGTAVAQPQNSDKLNACGVHIHTGTSCDSVGEDFYLYREGARNPWKDVYYGAEAAYATIPEPQPVFTGATLKELAGRTLVLYDSNGTMMSCSNVLPYGDLPTTQTISTTTTAAPASSSLPAWAIALIAVAAVGLLAGLAALFLCSGGKKRGLKKKSSKKRGVVTEEKTNLVAEPSPMNQPASVASPVMPVYTTPVYTTPVYHHVQQPVYSAPAASVYAPHATVAAPMHYAAAAAPVSTYAAPIPTYASPVATYSQGSVYQQGSYYQQ